MPEPERRRSPLARPASTATGTLVDRRKKLPFVLVERIILRSRRLSNNAKLLYLFLADYAGDEGSCFPGQPRLAADLQVKSVDTVARALHELRTVRLIDWKQQGLNRPNVYLLLPVEESALKSAIAATLPAPTSLTSPGTPTRRKGRIEFSPEIGLRIRAESGCRTGAES